MASVKDDIPTVQTAEGGFTALEESDITGSPKEPTTKIQRLRTQLLSRQTYPGSLLLNLLAFTLPALYSTLSKLWIANIDASHLATTDIYTYISVVANVLNDGLPRTAWLIISDKSTRSPRSRLSLSSTLITFQTLLGGLMCIIFIASASRLASAFVPREVRDTSLTYVRISSAVALSSAISVAVSACTRALDHPDVPLVISSTGFVVNIVLDLLVISKVRVWKGEPTINMQAWIRMACDLCSALVGLAYFAFVARKIQRSNAESTEEVRDSEADEEPPRRVFGVAEFKTLARPAIYTFLESAIRNALYLWLVSGIVSMGSDYATSWGVFNTIRWGLVMVPVQALEASTLVFVGHEWGRFRKRVGTEVEKPKAERRDLVEIVRPALISCCISLLVEVPMCIFLSLWGMHRFAFYLSESETVARITTKMWKTIDWCYIFYALNYQIAAILLACSPRWYLYQALGSNILWILPWAVVVTKVKMKPENAWTFYSIIFGGALVFDFFDVGATCAFWAWRLMRGKVWVGRITRTV